MENNDTDKLTRKILENSKLEINSPDFTSNLLGKIKAENRRKTIVRQSVFYLLMFVSIDAIIWTLFKLFGVSIADISLLIECISSEFANASSGKGNYLLLSLLIQSIILLIMIGRSRFFNFKNQ
jgi:hypothetical protein